MLRNLLMFSLLSLALPGAYAADVRLTTEAQVGTVKLAAGLYNVKIQGSVVIFSDVEKGKSATTMVKIEKMDKKAATTLVQRSTVDGVEHVQSILIGGSDEKLVFAN